MTVAVNYSGFLQLEQIKVPIEILPQLPHCSSVDVPAVLWGCADDDAVSDARIKTYQTMLIMMKLCGISRYWGLYPRIRYILFGCRKLGANILF